jgi:hypothetical protein
MDALAQDPTRADALAAQAATDCEESGRNMDVAIPPYRPIFGPVVLDGGVYGDADHPIDPLDQALVLCGTELIRLSLAFHAISSSVAETDPRYRDYDINTTAKGFFNEADALDPQCVSGIKSAEEAAGYSSPW